MSAEVYSDDLSIFRIVLEEKGGISAENDVVLHNEGIAALKACESIGRLKRCRSADVYCAVAILNVERHRNSAYRRIHLNARGPIKLILL